jgi:hypothetical protein
MIKAVSITSGVLLVAVLMALWTQHSDQTHGWDCVHDRSDRICSFARCQPVCPP